MKTLIIDDERLARTELRSVLEPFKNIEIVGEASNANEGIEMIDSLQPDLIFLDIQMPEKTGFDMLEELSNCPKVVFVTAYDEFAIQFFDEEQFEAYRQLGAHAGEGLFAPSLTNGNTDPKSIRDWFKSISKNLLLPD